MARIQQKPHFRPHHEIKPEQSSMCMLMHMPHMRTHIPTQVLVLLLQLRQQLGPPLQLLPLPPLRLPQRPLVLPVELQTGPAERGRAGSVVGSGGQGQTVKVAQRWATPGARRRGPAAAREALPFGFGPAHSTDAPWPALPLPRPPRRAAAPPSASCAPPWHGCADPRGTARRRPCTRRATRLR